MLSDPLTNTAVDFLSDPTGGILKFFKWLNFFGDSKVILGIWETIRVSFIVVDVIIAVALVGVFIAALKFRPNLRPSHIIHKKIFTLKDAVFKEQWAKIKTRVQTGSPDALRVAIIEADKFTDDVLKRMGLQGEHMADRLEKIPSQDIRSMDRLWNAHRLRNNLVHTPGFQVSAAEAKKALEDYEAFLKEVKVLQ